MLITLVSHLKVLGELFIELDVLLGVLRDVRDHVDGLLDKVLADHAEDLVLL